VNNPATFQQGAVVYDKFMRRFVIFDCYCEGGFAQVYVLDGSGDACYPKVAELRQADPGEQG
jgi:hypothetical protein